MTELRKDPIIDRWVILAPERKCRPSDLSEQKPSIDSDSCPFCVGNESMTPPEIFACRPKGSAANETGWNLRVVPNKFKVLSHCEPSESGVGSLYHSMSTNGRHEVLIESPDHMSTLEEMPERHIANCFSTFRERILSLRKIPSIKYVQIFKNHGMPAGGSLFHSHCQLIALPMIPELTHKEIVGAQKYMTKNGRCIYCDLIEAETQINQRIVAQNEHYIAFCAYAARFPYETWIAPKKHNSTFESEEHFLALAQVYKSTMSRICKVLNQPAYNFVLHSDPKPEKNSLCYHWHLEVLPKTTQLAGFELGSGCHINPVEPEIAAKKLREVD
tara:strand:+ start:485 stop:1474 length:990 start_codon:yes stop_codon:yes gene_type:complete